MVVETLSGECCGTPGIGFQLEGNGQLVLVSECTPTGQLNGQGNLVPNLPINNGTVYDNGGCCIEHDDGAVVVSVYDVDGKEKVNWTFGDVGCELLLLKDSCHGVGGLKFDKFELEYLRNENDKGIFVGSNDKVEESESFLDTKGTGVSHDIEGEENAGKCTSESSLSDSTISVKSELENAAENDRVENFFTENENHCGDGTPAAVGVKVQTDCDEKHENNGVDDGAENSDNCCGDDSDMDDDNDVDEDSDDDLDVHSFLARMDEDNAGSETNSIDGDADTGYTNPAIDRGYAWIVVIAVFFTHFMLIGYTKSGGLFFVEFQRNFDSSASMTSLVIGLAEVCYSLSAFVVLGFLVKIVSIRQLGLLGSLFLVVGVAGNAACDRIEFLMLTHSLCYGVASGLLYGPSLVIINEYFNKRRALAISLATTGASCGGIVFPLLARYLFDMYSFKGGILMTGGIIMQVFVTSSLLTPVKNHQRPINPSPVGTKVNSPVPNLPKPPRKSILEILKQRWNATRARYMAAGVKKDNDVVSIQKSNSSIYIKHAVQNNNTYNNKYLGSGIKSLGLEQFSSKLEICEEGVPLEIQSEYHTDKTQQEQTGDLPNDKKQTYGYQNNNMATDTSSLASHLDSSICSSNQHGGSRNWLDVYNSNPNELEVPNSHQMSNLVLMSKYSPSRQTLSRSIMFQSSSTLNNTLADIISMDHDCKRRFNDQSEQSRNVSAFRKILSPLCDSPLLRSVSFWILIPYYFAATVGSVLPQFYLVPFAKERGLSDEQASFCLSLLNILDIVAHMLPGIIVNCGLMTPTTVCILPMTVVAVMGQLTPLFHSYGSFLTLASIYGLFMGFYFAMQSLIIIDSLGIKNFNSSIGIYYLVIGLAGAVSFPIAGALKDLTGTYSTTYHYLATTQLLAVAILLVLPFARRYDVRRGVIPP